MTYLEQLSVLFIGYGLLVPLIWDRGTAYDEDGTSILWHKHNDGGRTDPVFEEFSFKLWPVIILAVVLYIPLSYLHSGNFSDWMNWYSGPSPLWLEHLDWMIAGGLLLLTEQFLTDFLDLK